NDAELDLIRGPGEETAGADAHDRPGPTPWKELLTSWAMFCICAQQFFRAAGYMFYGSWFTTFLRESRGVNTEEAGFLTSLPIWAIVAGGAEGGLGSDLLLARTVRRPLSRHRVSVVSPLGRARLTPWAHFTHHTRRAGPRIAV